MIMPMDHDSETSFLDWVGQILAQRADVITGPGDDCAVVACGDDQLLLKVDSVLEGTHFQRKDPDQPGYATLAEAGHKAMLRTLSDIAAMGGVPQFALVSLGIPQSATGDDRRAVMESLQASAARHDACIVGGDTKSWASELWSISVTLIGAMRGARPVLRSGGRAGDVLYVTGPLGGSILGKHKSPTPRLAEGRWLAQNGATAMIDLSDGLSLDLWRVCRASGCGARIAEVPTTPAARELAQRSARSAEEHALHDGEDYELLVAIPADVADHIVDEAPFPLLQVGELVDDDAGNDDPAITWMRDGTETPLPIRGYQHRWSPDHKHE